MRLIANNTPYWHPSVAATLFIHDSHADAGLSPPDTPTRPRTTHPGTTISSHPHSSDRGQSVCDREDLRQKLEIFLKSPGDTTWRIGQEHEFRQRTVVSLLDGGGLSDWLLEPLLGLLMADLSNNRWDTIFGAFPGPQRPHIDRVLIMKQRVCSALAAASGVESQPALVPRLKSLKNRWCHGVDGRPVSDCCTAVTDSLLTTIHAETY